MTKKRVLVTGGAGTIGTVTRPRLLERFDLSILDLKEVEGVETHVADIADLDAIRPAFEGKDVVVHLGGDPRGQAPWESVLRNNIVGVRNVLEASRLAGVGRVVFASTNHVVGFHPEKDESYKALFEGRFGDIRQPMELLTTEQTRPMLSLRREQGIRRADGQLLPRQVRHVVHRAEDRRRSLGGGLGAQVAFGPRHAAEPPRRRAAPGAEHRRAAVGRVCDRVRPVRQHHEGARAGQRQAATRLLPAGRRWDRARTR